MGPDPLVPDQATDSVTEKIELAASRHRRISLADAAGGGVARIGEERLAAFRALLVHSTEIVFEQDHFAAYLENLRRRIAQFQWHGADGADVGGDVLAGLAVTAGGGRSQDAFFVNQLDRETVELRLD